MPWWKQGTGYSEKGRKDRRLSMSEKMSGLWPAGSAAVGLSPGSWLRCALGTSFKTPSNGFKAACGAAVLPGPWKWPIRIRANTQADRLHA